MRRKGQHLQRMRARREEASVQQMSVQELKELLGAPDLLDEVCGLLYWCSSCQMHPRNALRTPHFDNLYTFTPRRCNWWTCASLGRWKPPACQVSSHS